MKHYECAMCGDDIHIPEEAPPLPAHVDPSSIICNPCGEDLLESGYLEGDGEPMLACDCITCQLVSAVEDVPAKWCGPYAGGVN